MNAPTGIGPPPPIQVLELSTSGWRSAALGAIASLGVADHLTSGPLPLTDLAVAVDADAAGLQRLMRAGVDIGIIREEPRRTYGLTDTGRVLVSDVPGSMRHCAIWMSHRAEWYPWAHLAETVRSRKPAFDATHGQALWEYLKEHPEASRTFGRAMAEISSLVAPGVVQTYDFSGAEVVVDVGGGNGSLIAAVLFAHEGVRGVLCERPEVLPDAEAALKRAGVVDRCELVAGDFLDSVPNGGDVYTLSNVLHNWDDPSTVRILENCREALGDRGRLAVVEMLVPASLAPSPEEISLLDLDMMLLCGGRQRSQDEFESLLDQAGLDLVAVHRSERGIASVIEAVAR